MLDASNPTAVSPLHGAAAGGLSGLDVPMRTGDQGAGARRPTRTGVAVVAILALAALGLLAASIFALTLVTSPVDRDKATAASFVLSAVGGAFMSFALMSGGALLAQFTPRHDRAVSRVVAAALLLTAIILAVITILGLIGGVWPQRVLGLVPLGAAALCLAEARRARRGYAVLIAEGEAERAAAIEGSAGE